MGSCVTITTVWPKASTTWRSRARMSPPVRVSSAPVGSSAKTPSGRGGGARAVAARRGGPAPGGGDALLLAAGGLGGAVLEPVAEADALDDLTRPGAVGAVAGEP